MEELFEQLAKAREAPLRHLWLRSVVDWLRGTDARVPQVLARLDQLLQRLHGDPALREQVFDLWRAVEEDLDLASVLAEFGFAGRGMFLAELGHRLMGKWLPASPVTRDAADLFALVFHDPRDAIWIQALAPTQVHALGHLLHPSDPAHGGLGQADAAGPWSRMVLRALTHCIGQISACGFRSDLRQRMSAQARATGCFDRIALQLQAVIEALPTGRAQLAERVEDLRFSLVEAQWAGVTVYEHLDEHGVSVEVVYQLRQLRRRVERAHLLLDVLASEQPARASVRLVAHLVRLDTERRSIRSLIADSTQMTAARVAERSAETGDHYITRDWPAYRHMLVSALGGGAMVGLTTWAKFLLAGASLSLFWSGWWAGVNYAMSFMLIQMLHLTLATKQPALTAPAMVARLRVLDHPASVFRFVDEVAHLIRSQMAAIAGNLTAVIPAVIVLNLLLVLISGHGMLSQDKARDVIEASQLLGPSVLFAALTGVLLFASSIVAGWAENWFVLNRLDSALAYHPTLRSWLGVDRAARWGAFLRRHVSGIAANISLGFMLGLLPVFAQFFGVYLDVRHVTLMAGQLSAAAMATGWSVLSEPAFWSAVVAVFLVGACNVLVSFYLAFQLAMKARGVASVDRKRIRLAIGLRLRRSPGSFFWPPAAGASPDRSTQ